MRHIGMTLALLLGMSLPTVAAEKTTGGVEIKDLIKADFTLTPTEDPGVFEMAAQVKVTDRLGVATMVGCSIRCRLGEKARLSLPAASGARDVQIALDLTRTTTDDATAQVQVMLTRKDALITSPRVVMPLPTVG